MEGTICKRKNKIINFWSSPYLPQKKKKKKKRIYFDDLVTQ
jgi:hypothetical protein